MRCEHNVEEIYEFVVDDMRIHAGRETAGGGVEGRGRSPLPPLNCEIWNEVDGAGSWWRIIIPDSAIPVECSDDVIDLLFATAATIRHICRCTYVALISVCYERADEGLFLQFAQSRP